MAVTGNLTRAIGRKELTRPRHGDTAAYGGVIVTGGAFALLYIYTIIDLVRPQDLLGLTHPLFRPALVLTFLLAIYWISKWGVKALYDGELVAYPLAIVLLGAVFIPFARNNFSVLQATIALTNILVAVTIPMGLMLVSAARRKQFVTLWILIGLYYALWCLTHGGQGPGGYLADENDVAFALCMVIPYPFFLAHRKGLRAFTRWSYYGASLIIFAAIVSTHSRGGFVALACVLLYAAYLSEKRLRALFALLIIGVVSLQFVPESYVARIGTIADAEDGSRSERLFSWKLGWHIFLDYPILGVGPRNYPWYSGDYQVRLPEYQPGDKIIAGRAAHSLYFQMLPEAGLVGTGLFVLLLLATRRKLNMIEAASKESAQLGDDAAETNLLLAKALKASMLAYLTAGAFISVFYYAQFWYTLGLVAALSRDVSVRHTDLNAKS